MLGLLYLLQLDSHTTFIGEKPPLQNSCKRLSASKSVCCHEFGVFEM